MRRHRSQLPCVQTVAHALRHAETNMIYVVLLFAAWFVWVKTFKSSSLFHVGTLLELNSLWCLRLIPPFVCYRLLTRFSSRRHVNYPCPCFWGWTSSLRNVQSRILNVVKCFHPQDYFIWFKSKQSCYRLPVLSWCGDPHGVHQHIPHSVQCLSPWKILCDDERTGLFFVKSGFLALSLYRFSHLHLYEYIHRWLPKQHISILLLQGLGQTRPCTAT
jgi:hypothetical protein